MSDDPPRLADPRAVLHDKSRNGVREKQNVKLQLAGSQVVVSRSPQGKLFHRSLRVLTRRDSCIRPCPSASPLTSQGVPDGGRTEITAAATRRRRGRVDASQTSPLLVR